MKSSFSPPVLPPESRLFSISNKVQVACAKILKLRKTKDEKKSKYYPKYQTRKSNKEELSQQNVAVTEKSTYVRRNDLDETKETNKLTDVNFTYVRSKHDITRYFDKKEPDHRKRTLQNFSNCTHLNVVGLKKP